MPRSSKNLAALPRLVSCRSARPSTICRCSLESFRVSCSLYSTLRIKSPNRQLANKRRVQKMLLNSIAQSRKTLSVAYMRVSCSLQYLRWWGHLKSPQSCHSEKSFLIQSGPCFLRESIFLSHSICQIFVLFQSHLISRIYARVSLKSLIMVFLSIWFRPRSTVL